jgi:electron transfer flavoprotein alpha subunit
MERQPIMVVLETTPTGELTAQAAELLGVAARLGTPIAVIATSSDQAVAAAGQAGAARVIVVPVTTDDAVLAMTEAAAKAADYVAPAAVLVAHTLDGREAAARLAIRTRRALLLDVIGVDRDDEGIYAHHSVFGGRFMVDSAATVGAPVITVRQAAVADRAPATTPAVTVLEACTPSAPTACVTSFTPNATGDSRPSLRGAKKVVAGGKGMSSKAKFDLVGELADALGAGVGASRAAVDAGYITFHSQVGQSAAVISPDLYVALGISGAIQHLAGMQTAKTIVAVNRDPDAPIFKIADFGIVGDLFDVVPQAIAVLAARGGR